MTAIPQHLQALAHANEVRTQRHELKQTIANGGRTAATVILSPPDFALTMTVYDVLIAQRRWGAHRTRKLLRVAQVTDRKLLGELTYRQQKVLADLLTWDRA